MELRRGIILILVMAAMTTVTILPCSSEEKNTDKDIWEDGPRGPGGGPGRGGPGGGPGRRPGWGRGRFELTEEYIDRFLKELNESNPSKVKDLERLREKDPEKFKEEIRKNIREHWLESWRNRWRAEFLEWLGNAVPKEVRDLNNLKDTDPDLYTKKYEIIRGKYRRIFEEGRRNPELAEVLMAELELEERQEVLVKKIKATKSEKEKKKLMSQLEEVVGNKYDLIIRRKQIAYEFLLKRVEELQKELRENRDEIAKWQDEKIKAQNIKERIKELTEQSRKFRWR